MLYRAKKADIETDGRNLIGLAAKWDAVSSVTDDGITFYDEAFASTSANKTLKERAAVPLPLGYFHPWSPGTPGSASEFADTQLGNVKFAASSEGLVFRARLFKTEEGDAMLEKVNSGEVSDVSIGFNPYKSETINNVVVRKEIGLVELSLAPSGMGQHEGATVLAVRASQMPLYASLSEVRRQIAYLSLFK